MNFYRNSPAAARRYLEADRSRADDYYLTEGTGLAERFSASPTVGVRHEGSLDGDRYEAWVAGVDPQTGVPKGRLRNSDNAVRFVEVTVNGPKSWSLAAAIHPDISRAYDAAQERAAEQIIGWLAQHSTTRIGPRGGQVQVPVELIEAVTVRHYTSRAGDPHRHLHLQINARVQAEGRWYGIHTVGVRDSLDAINGIGHAAIVTDQGFREALAAHGYTLDGDGELSQMREFVGPFSQRAAQIEANLTRYETAWKRANPGREPGPALRQKWDHQAWNDARPGKITPKDGAEITAAWLAELHELGYRDPAGPVLNVTTRPGEVDRERAVETVLARLGKRRSGWNAADVRGEVEQLIARENVVTDPAVRLELAEDLTARTLAECVPLVDRPGLPEHLRALTSQRVLEVEADLTVRFIARSQTPASVAASLDAVPAETLDRLDVAQRQAVSVLAGTAELVVIEGAAGAGKTTTLAAARAALDADGHRLMVVTPTRKAAQVASKELGTRAYSAAWLATQHGWRYDEHGTWTRLTPGEVGVDEKGRQRQYPGPKPEAQLGRGDVLLVDEAGMLDQDTAHALLHVADETGARVVLLGDRHQLPAVGRGGVLDLAARYAPDEACVELTTVHRFTDPDYARLSLAMRTGENSGAVFDTLLERDLIRVYNSEVERTDALASDTADALMSDRDTRVMADTNAQTDALNTAVREHLVAAGQVDDNRVVTTRAGQRIGTGDVVMTRQNSTDLDVANREVWTVTHVNRRGDVTVTGASGTRALDAEYARRHVQLAYASTVHAAQGETVDAAHAVLGEHTGAASAYVAMTRGRDSNTVHIVADSIEDARDQWIDTFSRGGADLGPAVAAQRVAVEANNYAPKRPVADALADLYAAWTVEADLRRQLNTAVARRQKLHDVMSALADHNTASDRLDAELRQARHTAQTINQRADHVTQLIDTTTTRYANELQQTWDHARPTVRDLARTVLDGPGRLGIHRRAVANAHADLTRWANNWRPVVPDLPTDPEQLSVFAARYDGTEVQQAIYDHARRAVEHAHPSYRAILDTAKTAAEDLRQLRRDYPTQMDALNDRLLEHGSLALAQNPEQLLDAAEQQVTDLTARHDQAQHAVAAVLREPAIRSQPPERIRTEHDTWTRNRHAQHQATQAAEEAARRAELPAMLTRAIEAVHRHEPLPDYTGLGHSGLTPDQPDHGIGI